MSRTKTLGTRDGNLDGINRDLRGSRESFIKRHPLMPESDYRTYAQAYDDALGASTRLFYGGRS